MISAPAQKTLATHLSELATLKSIYTDQDILAKVPFFAKVSTILQNALPRPVSPFYLDISNAIQQRIHRALTRQSNPAATLSALQSDLQAIVNK
jgi:multiple sugar transport system substrate-binding protein